MANPPPPEAPSNPALEDTAPSLGPEALAEASVVELSNSVLVDDASALIEYSRSAIVADEPEPAAAPADPAADPLIGKVISGRYLVGELLGAGGMGAVYRGEQVHLRKRVAIKILRPSVRRLPELVARFEREAIAGAHVQHPNVVSAIDFGQLEDKSYFLILEYVEGTPLRDVIAAGPLAPPRALRIARQLAAALEAVHQQGIVHRDVKPHNILLDARDQVKLIDFGLAKVRVELLSSATRDARPAPALTNAGEIFGTLAYLAPEAGRGMDAVDARADLYAMGIVFYQMLCGKHPFDAPDFLSLFKRQRAEDPPLLSERVPGLSLPPGVEPLVMRLIQRDPDRRYASASEVLAAIDGVLAAVEGSGFVAAAMIAPVATPVPAAAPAPVAAGQPMATPVPVAAPAPTPSAHEPLPAALAPPPTALAPAAVARAIPRRPSSRAPLIAAAVLVPLLMGGAALLLFGRAEPEEPPPVAATSAPEPPAPPEQPPAQPPPPAEIDGYDAAGWQERLERAAATKGWVTGAKAVIALAELEPARLKDPMIRGDIVAIAAGIGFERENEDADRVFDILAKRLGSDGPDILFDIVRSRGNTRAGRRALELLEKPEVMALATPALKITHEFRTATCGDKRALFDRAAAEGDARTLFELQVTKDARCASRRDPCCFQGDAEIVEAIQKLKARLGGG